MELSPDEVSCIKSNLGNRHSRFWIIFVDCIGSNKDSNFELIVQTSLCVQTKRFFYQNHFLNDLNYLRKLTNTLVVNFFVFKTLLFFQLCEAYDLVFFRATEKFDKAFDVKHFKNLTIYCFTKHNQKFDRVSHITALNNLWIFKIIISRPTDEHMHWFIQSCTRENRIL